MGGINNRLVQFKCWKCVNNTTKEYDERYKSTDTVGTIGTGIVMAQKGRSGNKEHGIYQTYPIANPKTGMISLGRYTF